MVLIGRPESREWIISGLARKKNKMPCTELTKKFLDLRGAELPRPESWNPWVCPDESGKRENFLADDREIKNQTEKFCIHKPQCQYYERFFPTSMYRVIKFTVFKMKSDIYHLLLLDFYRITGSKLLPVRVGYSTASSTSSQPEDDLVNFKLLVIINVRYIWPFL